MNWKAFTSHLSRQRKDKAALVPGKYFNFVRSSRCREARKAVPVSSPR